MTIDEFRDKISKEYELFTMDVLSKSKEEVFNEAYTIAKTFEIYNYIVESEVLEERDDFLDAAEDFYFRYPYESFLSELCDYSDNCYEEPMWCTWGNLYEMIQDYANSLKYRRQQDINRRTEVLCTPNEKELMEERIRIGFIKENSFREWYSKHCANCKNEEECLMRQRFYQMSEEKPCP